MINAIVAFQGAETAVRGYAEEFYRGTYTALFHFIASPSHLALCPPAACGRMVIKVYSGQYRKLYRRELEMTKVLALLQGIYIPSIYSSVAFSINDHENTASDIGKVHAYAIAMEYLPGMNLEEYMYHPDSDKSASRIDTICDAIVETCAEATKLHVYHGDLWPRNLMFVPLDPESRQMERYTDQMKQRRFRIVMIDFDAARIRDANHEGEGVRLPHNDSAGQELMEDFRAGVEEYLTSTGAPTERTVV